MTQQITPEDIKRMEGMAYRSKSKLFPEGALSVREATKEQVEQLRIVSEQWDDKVFSHPTFIEVEKLLDQMPYCAQGKQYVLVPDADPEGLSIRSAAKTYTVELFLALPSSVPTTSPNASDAPTCTDTEVGLTKVKSSNETLTIQGIYVGGAGTPLEHRRKGYATMLINHMLDSANVASGDYTAGVLLSMADKVFEKYTSLCKVLYVSLQKEYNFQRTLLSEGTDLQHIFEDDLEPIFAEDCNLLKFEMQNHAEKIQKPVLCIVPTTDCLQIRSLRSRLCLERGIGQPQVNNPDWKRCGCMIGRPGDSNWAYILWRLVSSNVLVPQKKLFVSRLRYNSTEQLQLLLQTALDTAQAWGQEQGIEWMTTVENRADVDALGLPSRLLKENEGAPMSRLILGGVKDPLEHDFYLPENYFYPR